MAAVRNVVIAMDGSEYSAYAFDWYLKTVRKPNDHVIMVYCPEYHTIIQSPLTGDLTRAAEQVAKDEARIKSLLEHLGDKLRDSKINGKVKSCTGGSPGEVVVRVADEENASFIITGSRGSGLVRRTIMGSVSDYIIHHSHIPVVVCRHKDHHHHHHHQHK